MKVVGLSGAQGAGKSTLLIELMARGWQLDQFRVSRAVQAQLGWDTLENVMSSPQTMMEFQNEVLRQKQKHDWQLAHVDEGARTMDPKGHITLTERTFADIVAYTNQWSWRFVDDGRMTLGEAISFLSDFTRRAAHAQNEIYTGTMLLPMMNHVVWEEDPNRAAQADTESVMEDIERFMERKANMQKRFMITGKTVNERADQVETFLRTL
jgi:predicted ATPase